MKQFLLVFTILLFVGTAEANGGHDSRYRELKATFSYGAVVPSGDWKDLMDTGQSVRLGLGMAASSRLSIGIHFGYGTLKPKVESISPFNVSVQDNKWDRYSGGVFGEYQITKSSFSPFVGGSLGVHGVHISYDELLGSISGQGDYGFGYGLTAGIQYRGGGPVGGVIRFGAEYSPELDTGWFTNYDLGLRLFF